MTDRAPLFRPEAIEAHARGRSDGDEGLELKEDRTTWAFRALLVALGIALLVAFTYQVDETVRGPAVPTGSTALVEVPATAIPRLKVGLPVRLGGVTGEVTKLEGTSVRERDDVAVVMLRVTFDAPVSSGEATVLLDRRTLAELLRRKSG